jgi:hypothetical protein
MSPLDMPRDRQSSAAAIWGLGDEAWIERRRDSWRLIAYSVGYIKFYAIDMPLSNRLCSGLDKTDFLYGTAKRATNGIGWHGVGGNGHMHAGRIDIVSLQPTF